MKDVKKAYILNLWIVCLEVFSVGWMLSGLRLPGTGDALSASHIAALKYFTVDSNILMGVVAFIIAIDVKKILDGKSKFLPRKDYILALIGTTGVSLTMLVTVFYLAPTLENGWFACFNNSNVFLHLINPVLSIITYICYEKTDILTIKDIPFCLVPIFVYAVYYVTMAIINSKDGYVLPGYDFYGFFHFGLMSGFIVFPIIILITLAIGAGLYKLNHK